MGSNPLSPPRHLRSWKRRLWFIAVAGLVLALSPLTIALVGLIFNSQYLMTYHWVLYYSVPIGLPITLVAGLAALVMTLRDGMKARAKQDDDE